MKYLLIIMCGIVVLFMGGCAIVSVMAFPFPLIPGGIAALNLAIIGVILGWRFQWRPAFYTLGAVDLLIAIAALATAASMGPQDQPFFLACRRHLCIEGCSQYRLCLAHGGRT